MKKLLARLCIVLMIAQVILSASAEAPETKTIRIIATSDLHGKFVPWDYALNAENASGSVAQLATAVSAYRTEDTILVDGGDTVQDNSAEIFIGDVDVHPMIQAINALDYDVWVTGNHEYDFGLDKLKKIIRDLQCRVLTGNVYDTDGNAIADGYAILEKNGIRVAVIGMVTPNIARWSVTNLAGCAVTDPLEETRRIIDSIRGQYDVLVGVFHMGLENEYNLPNSGVTDILNACPEFDVMVSAHEHNLISGEEINGVLVVQNRNQAQTMVVIDLTLERDGAGWRVVDRVSQSVGIADYEADPAMLELLKSYDLRAREDANRVIGRLEGGALAPENEIDNIPAPRLHDTALVELVNTVQMYYADTDVAAASLPMKDANLYPGDIRKCDVAKIYSFSNPRYKLHMTGAQLKKFMEYSAGFYNTFRPGDTTVSFNERFPPYLYNIFEGVCYEVNLSHEPGSRIERLTWPDGTPVRDDDAFDIAMNNYVANSQLLVPDVIYEADDLPVLVEKDIHDEIGGIRELIGDYIVSVRNGHITPECNDNWRITGCEGLADAA